MNTVVFWDIVPCSLVDIDRLLIGAYCLLMMEAVRNPTPTG
jgi:hypothetical protein